MPKSNYGKKKKQNKTIIFKNKNKTIGLHLGSYITFSKPYQDKSR